MELTQELVQSLFDYRDGELYRKTYRSPNAQIGDKAGTLHHSGYYQININNKIYFNHQIIFLYFNNYLPKMIDHIDNNSLNNNINNLREVTNSQNSMNCKSYKNSTSKYKGVSWNKRDKIWVSFIKINEKGINLGSFKDEKAAAFIYNVYARGAFGEYAYLNDLGDDNL